MPNLYQQIQHLRQKLEALGIPERELASLLLSPNPETWEKRLEEAREKQFLKQASEFCEKAQSQQLENVSLELARFLRRFAEEIAIQLVQMDLPKVGNYGKVRGLMDCVQTCNVTPTRERPLGNPDVEENKPDEPESRFARYLRER